MSDVALSIEATGTASAGGKAVTWTSERQRPPQTKGGFLTSHHPSDIRMEPPPEDARFWLAAIADSSDDAIVGKDLDGVVTFWNNGAEALFGYAASEIVGKSISIVIPPDLADEEISILDRIRREERIVGLETKRLCKDGRIIPVSITVSPIHDDQNRIIGISKIAHDLTRRDEREHELRVANAELERLARHLAKERDRASQANRAKSRFLAGMSHELRTPLNGILGYAELLHMDGGLSATQRARVESMLAAGKHLLQMITCVLDLSEIEADRAEVQLVESDVQAIASACVDLARPSAEAKALALSMAVTPGTKCRIVTDPMRLRQVLINLLGNAVKFTHEGAIELRLRTLADSSALRFEVTDSGPGILPDQRQRLFQDFERLQAATAKPTEGAGLGLFLSSRLAALMGGRVGHDDNPSGGSVFWLELPAGAAAKSTLAPIPALEVREAEAGPAKALNVLVVDDVLMNRDIAGSFLSAAGHKVTYASEGDEAVAAVMATSFDVVLMDLRMPRTDGFEATRQIRALGGERGRVPIVAVTAHAFTEQVEECRKAGMDGHLPKPFSQAALLAAVGRAAATCQAPSESPGDVLKAPAESNQTEDGGLLVLDRTAFDHTASYLAPGAVLAYMQTIVSDGQALLHDLRDARSISRDPNKVAQAVHTLAGSAGLFGFERLAAVGRLFDQALRLGTADGAVTAGALIRAIEATIEAIRDCTASMAAAAPSSVSSARQRRILIVEDDAKQTEVLKSVLGAAGFAVDAVTSGLDAVRQIRPGLFDVVLVDYEIPDINGLALAKLIGDFLGQIARPVLIALTATPDHLMSRESGAKSAFDAVIGKSTDYSILMSTIARSLESEPGREAMQRAEAMLLVNEDVACSAEGNRPAVPGGLLTPPRILLAEDEEMQRKLLTAVFEHRGYVVEAASNGLDALRKIREICYDLALVDYDLPEVDGLALGRLVLDLMQEEARPRLIALTATPDRLNDMETVRGKVFDEVLAKSSDLGGLISAVDRHLRSSPNPATRIAAALTSPADKLA